MDEKKLRWCLKQKRGIKLIEEKEHLSDAYLAESDKTLENVKRTPGKWKIITAYYACYSAFYAILMKCGIKSEIHDCTLALLSLFNFSESEIKFIEELKESRIKVQYYLVENSLKDETKVKEFILKCKTILGEITTENIGEIRNKIKGVKDE